MVHLRKHPVGSACFRLPTCFKKFHLHSQNYFKGRLNGIALCTLINIYEGWNFNSGNYLFTTDTK